VKSGVGSSHAFEMSPQRLGHVRSRVLAWYAEHQQDFPWRTARDPYLALVAAVCAQQTQMSRVLPTYERWVRAFPTLEAAAAASNVEVLRVWARAGYPRRAIAIRDASRVAVERYGGALPRDEDALLELPGVGPFTAAIVRCFGYGLDAAAVDTNIIRVVGRLVYGDLQPARETPRAAIDEAVQRLLRPGTAARWNPALMDYGARVCTPRPRCEACVVASMCRARPRFADGERAAPVRAQGPFAGSDREWRGRLLAELRARSGPVRAAALIGAVASTPGDRERARANLDALIVEGLAWRRGARCGLGDAPEASRASK
jgi:A/G-specific adenine glycosylase